MVGKDTYLRTLHLVLPAVCVEVLLLHFPANIEIMAKLALATLLTVPSLVERAENGLGINTEGHFLRLHGLEHGCFLLLAFLLLQLGLSS